MYRNQSGQKLRIGKPGFTGACHEFATLLMPNPNQSIKFIRIKQLVKHEKLPF
jgi:hypothetical protein